MATWLKDGKYDPRPFESCLLEAFGQGRRMFDTADGAISGTRHANLNSASSRITMD